MAFKKEKFLQVWYFEHAGKGAANGSSPDNAAALVDATMFAIPAGLTIERVYLIIDTAITGTTNFDVGDDDDADGFLDGSLSVTLGTAGMYGYNAKTAGAYLRVETAGATDAADIYVVPTAKYYSVGTKNVKLDITTASTAGKGKVVVEGFLV